MRFKGALSNSIRTSRHNQYLPIELSLDSVSSEQKKLRTSDTKITKEFNQDVDRWSIDQTRELRTSVLRNVRRNISLSGSIRKSVFYNRKGGKEAERVGFSFNREGIYIHKGAGRGQGGIIGSSWIDRYGNKKTRKAESSGLMNTRGRLSNEWFDPVMEKNIRQLQDIVTDYAGTLQVNATSLLVEK